MGQSLSVQTTTVTNSDANHNVDISLNIPKKQPKKQPNKRGSFLRDIQYDVVIKAYIFQIEQELSCNTIIPETIISLCLQYYHHDQLIYLVSPMYLNDLPLSATNMPCDTIWQSKIIGLSRNVDTSLRINDAHIITARNVTLPISITHKSNAKYRQILEKSYRSANVFDVVFCSGVKRSYALIIDPLQNYLANDVLYALYWQIPSGIIQWPCTATAFSHKNGLIQFRGNGEKTSGYYLPLQNVAEYKDFRNSKHFLWHQMTDTIQPHHISTVSVLEYEDKLVALGGRYPMEIYDFQTKEWDLLDKPNLFPSSSYYDPRTECLFVSNCINKMDYYDFNKQKWVSLPDTNNSYYEDITISKQYNLLYIASSLGNPMECIDIRMQRAWKVCNTVIQTETHSTFHYV
eukprot:334635_1